jgi:hypothetical protein
MSEQNKKLALITGANRGIDLKQPDNLRNRALKFLSELEPRRTVKKPRQS